MGLLVMGLAAGTVQAEVLDAQPAGFAVRHKVQIAAPQDRVWAQLTGGVGNWWNPEHTWFGDAKNLRIDPRLGGCFCETSADGAVEHLRVINVRNGAQLVLSGGLGPLQSAAVAATLTWSLAEKDGITTVTQTYVVGGFRVGGLFDVAPPVDQVMTEQLDRLKRWVETGNPAPT